MSIVGGSYLRSNQAAVKSRVSLPLESVGTPSHNLNHTSQGDHSVSSTHRLFQNIKLTKNKNEGRVTQHVPKKSDEFDSMSVQDNQRFRWGDRDYPSESSPINEKPTSLFRREAFAAPSQALFNWPQDSSSPVNLELKASAPDLKKQEEPSFNPVATRATPPIQLDSKAGRVGDLQSLRNHPNNKSNLSTDRNEKSTGRSRIKTRNHTLDPILQQSLLTRVVESPMPKARSKALSHSLMDKLRQKSSQGAKFKQEGPNRASNSVGGKYSYANVSFQDSVISRLHKRAHQSSSTAAAFEESSSDSGSRLRPAVVVLGDNQDGEGSRAADNSQTKISSKWSLLPKLVGSAAKQPDPQPTQNLLEPGSKPPGRFGQVLRDRVQKALLEAKSIVADGDSSSKLEGEEKMKSWEFSFKKPSMKPVEMIVVPPISPENTFQDALPFLKVPQERKLTDVNPRSKSHEPSKKQQEFSELKPSILLRLKNLARVDAVIPDGVAFQTAQEVGAMFSTLKNYLSTNNPTEVDGSKRNPHKAYRGANLDVIEVKQKTIHGKKRIIIGTMKAKHSRKNDKERGKSSPVMQALATQQPNRSLASIAGRVSDRKHSNRTSMSRVSMASVDAAHPGANLLNHSNYDGFTSIKLNLSNFTVKILRPVHMFGLDRVEIRVETLIKKFVHNWKEWLGKVTGQTAQITEWVTNTCRHKNVFLQKFLVEELDPAKAVSEKAVIEVIFGPQPIIKQPLKRSQEEQTNTQPSVEKQARRRESVSAANWDTRSRSTQQDGPRGVDGVSKSVHATEPSILANLVFAPDRTYDTVKSILEDLIELNYLIEFESLRNKEEQYKIMCEGYGVQAKKNMDVFRHVKNYINRNYWKHGESRMEFERVMKMIKQEANYNPFATRGFSIIDQIDMFEKQYGRMEHLGLKSRVCAQHIVKNSTMQLETLLRGKAAEQKVPVKTIEEVRDELREKIRSGETPGSVLQRFASIAEYNRDESSESPSVSPASSPRSRKLISPISKTNKMNF